MTGWDAKVRSCQLGNPCRSFFHPNSERIPCRSERDRRQTTCTFQNIEARRCRPPQYVSTHIPGHTGRGLSCVDRAPSSWCPTVRSTRMW